MLALAELEDALGRRQVLEAVLPEIDEPVAPTSAAVDALTTTWPPCAAAAIRAARCTSNPT